MPTNADRIALVARSNGYPDSIVMVDHLKRWGWSDARIARMCHVSESFLRHWIKRAEPRLSAVQLQAMAHHLSGVKI